MLQCSFGMLPGARALGSGLGADRLRASSRALGLQLLYASSFVVSSGLLLGRGVSECTLKLVWSACWDFSCWGSSCISDTSLRLLCEAQDHLLASAT